MNTNEKDDSLTLSLLEAIDGSSDVTQRHLAQRLGVALGLANSYLKRCVRKGLVKVQQAPANRYAYYLTPKGFAEKSRLTAEYLRYSLSFYRLASDSVESLLGACKADGELRIVLAGVSDLAEIAVLKATAMGMRVVAIYDPDAGISRWASVSVQRKLPASTRFDVCVLTELERPSQTYAALVDRLGAERVRVPDVLGVQSVPDDALAQ